MAFNVEESRTRSFGASLSLRAPKFKCSILQVNSMPIRPHLEAVWNAKWQPGYQRSSRSTPGANRFCSLRSMSCLRNPGSVTFSLNTWWAT